MEEPLLQAVMLLLGLALGFLLGRLSSRRSKAGEGDHLAGVVAEADTALAVKLQGVPRTGSSYLIEELFLLYNDGRLMAHMGTSASESDLVGSMLSAITDFIKESFKQSGELGAIDHGENRILLESGRYVKLALVIYGREDEALRELLTSTVSLVETHLQDNLTYWDGSQATVRRARELLSPMVISTANVTREQVRIATRQAGVKLSTLWEFEEGLVILRVGVANNTPSHLHNCQLGLHFAAERALLVQVEPELPQKETTVSLGQVLPESQTEVVFALDLLDCQALPLEVSLLYHTGADEAQQMASRRLELISPAGFNPLNANRAMALRYLNEHMGLRDASVMPIPGNLSPLDSYHLLRYALAQLHTTPVVERRREEPVGFEGWYTAQTLPEQSSEILPFLFKAMLDSAENTMEFLLAAPDQQALEAARAEILIPLQKTLDSLSASHAIEV